MADAVPTEFECSVCLKLLFEPTATMAPTPNDERTIFGLHYLVGNSASIQPGTDLPKSNWQNSIMLAMTWRVSCEGCPKSGR